MTEIVIRTQSFRSPVSISLGDGVVECTLEFASLGERLLTFTSPLLSRWDVPSAGILSKLPMGRRQMGRPICRHFVQTADGPSADGTVSSGYILPNLKTGRQQMGRPNCQHFDQSADMPPFCRRSRLQTGQNVGRWAVPSANILSNLQTGRRPMGRSHLATFCPIWRRDVSRWDVPTVNILPNLLTCHPFCRRSGLQTGQNVGRWAVLSANILPNLPTFCPICRRAVGRWDGLIWLLFAQSEDGTSADGMSQLPTFCPICWHAIHFADDPGCRRDKMLADRPSHLPTFCPICRHFVQSADGSSADGTVSSGYILPNLKTGRQQMGRPNCQHFAQSADMPSILPTIPPADGTKCWQMGRPICQHFAQSADILSNLQTGRRQMGRSHLATFCPIWRRDVSRWDVPTANIFPNLLTCHPFCRRSWLQTGQNVDDGPIWLHFAQSADGMSADGTSPLPTFCPVCQRFIQSAYRTKCSQICHPVCRRAPLQIRQNVGRWAVPSADGPVYRRDASPDGLVICIISFGCSLPDYVHSATTPIQRDKRIFEWGECENGTLSMLEWHSLMFIFTQ